MRAKVIPNEPIQVTIKNSDYSLAGRILTTAHWTFMSLIITSILAKMILPIFIDDTFPMFLMNFLWICICLYLVTLLPVILFSSLDYPDLEDLLLTPEWQSKLAVAVQDKRGGYRALSSDIKKEIRGICKTEKIKHKKSLEVHNAIQARRAQALETSEARNQWVETLINDPAIESRF